MYGEKNTGMKFSMFTKHGALISPDIFNAIRQGLTKLGHTVTENEMDCDIPVIWSLLWNGRMMRNKSVWDHFRNKNKNVLVVEVGGIQRNKTWKIALNGINRKGDFGPINNAGDRAQKLNLQLKPWRQSGDHILICLQHDKSEQWASCKPLLEYTIETITELRKHTDRRIIVRQHPRCPLQQQPVLDNVFYQTPKMIENTYDDYDLEFNNEWAVVSWSSNPGIHAVLNGIPAFVGPQSLAYDVANHDLSMIEKPLMPDRAQWLNDYAYTEWTVEEIAQGTPFSRLTF